MVCAVEIFGGRRIGTAGEKILKCDVLGGKEVGNVLACE